MSAAAGAPPRTPQVESATSTTVSTSEWASLPLSLLELIFQRISPTHLQWSRLVCKHWRWVIRTLITDLAPYEWAVDGKLALTFPSITELCCERPGSYLGHDLSAFRGLEHLKELTLTGSNDMRSLATGLEGMTLVSLDLTGCKLLASKDLGHLSVLTSLNSLAYRFHSGRQAGCVKIIVEAAPHLTHLCLEYLVLDENPADHLQHLAQLSNLLSLNLYHCGLSWTNRQDGVQPLSCLTTLQRLSMPGVHEDNLSALLSLVGLTHLDLSFNRRLSNPGLEFLTALTQLQSLDLQGSAPVTGSGLKVLTHLTAITHLNVKDLLMTFPMGSQPLTAFHELRSLAVSGSTLAVRTALEPGAQLLEQVARCHGTRLTHLDLSRCLLHRGPVADQSALECLLVCSQLRSLLLEGTRSIQDSDLLVISHLSGLEVLMLPVNDNCMEYSDNGLRHLSGCTKLVELQLDVAHVSPTGLKDLTALTGLTKLHVAHRSMVGNLLLPWSRLLDVQKALNSAFSQCLDLEVCCLLPDLSASWKPETLRSQGFELGRNIERVLRMPGASRRTGAVL